MPSLAEGFLWYLAFIFSVVVHEASHALAALKLGDETAYNGHPHLRTPALDFSGYQSVVVRFSSYYFFDELETINVDVSTDGGTVWEQAWQNLPGFNHTPFRAVLDLSSFIAGQANVMLRFRFDSEDGPQGNLWQIDDVELEGFTAALPQEDLPDPATGPCPGHCLLLHL